MQTSSLLGRRTAHPAAGATPKPVAPSPRVASTRQVACNVATGPRPPMTTFTGGNKGPAKQQVSLDLRDEGAGMFTSTSPEMRRVVPDDVKGRVKVKVVYVVLEAQYQSAISAAVKNINAKNSKVCFEVVGYLLEELRDQKNLDMLKEDVASANIFIGSLIFIEELAEKIVEAVSPLREKLDACLIFPSMPAVMKLNKLGTFSMAQLGQSKSVFSEFIKSARKNNDNFEEGLLKLVRTLPKVLKYLPSDKAQDAKNFVNSLQYWLGGNSDNLENLLLNTVSNYVPALKGVDFSVAEPTAYPDVGIWHPLASGMYEDLKEYLNWYDTRKDMVFAKDAPVIGLVLQRSHLVTGDEGHYSGVVAELESRGAKVIPVFAGGLDFSAPVKKFFYDPLGSGRTFVDTVVSLTGFALVGGPARQDAPKAIEALKNLNVPYLVSLPLVFQTTEEWLDSELGVHPVQVALQVALPELDGAMEPIVFAGRDSNTGKSHSLPDRIASLCARAVNWANLRKKRNAEKKLAVTVFSFPPDKGNVGTAAYLNVFGSIYRVLKNLQREGYDVGALPPSEEDLIQSVLTQKEAKFNSTDLHIAYKMKVDEYQKLCPYAEALEENWGKPPGTLNTNGQELLVYGRQYGNVFIGVQPTFGYEGDPMRLLFSKSASPHHGFAAYYTFLEKIFKADAVLHFGTHGSLEFMPGKQVGMSGVCYPDSLIGTIPNLYYYAANNPSEATIAKRRSYANTISYLTPPAENAGLYKGLKELKELISSYQGMRESGRAEQICATIIETAKLCNLDRDVTLPDADAKDLTMDMRDSVVGQVYRKLMEIESRLLPCGLHVVGCPPTAEEAVATLVNIAELDRPDNNPPIKGMPGILARAIGRDIESIYSGNNKGVLADVDQLQRITEASRTCVREFVKDRTGLNGRIGTNWITNLLKFTGFYVDPWVRGLQNGEFASANREELITLFNYLEFCLTQVVKDNELGALVEALNGQYVEPGPGGDPIRNPNVLPTGKNIHALDPQSIPTQAALKSARLVVDRLLDRERDNNGGKYPETIALVLWGTDNIKTYGESLAQVMMMVGVKPVADALGRVNKLEVIPLEELGRPRVDVVVNCSGVFRDLFVNQMLLLDRAIKLAAEQDEPDEMNFVRKHAKQQAAELGLQSLRDAATRANSAYAIVTPSSDSDSLPAFFYSSFLVGTLPAMFGFGRGGDDEVRKLRGREKELERELATASQSLLSAEQRAESAEAKANLLASQNRALALKVHRLALQRVELQSEKQIAEQANTELKLQNLRLENEARVAKAAEADAWQVTNLKTALKQQAAQYETKLSSFKRRTKAFLTAVLPGTHAARGLSMGGAGAPSSPNRPSHAGANPRSAPGSPTADLSLPDLWDAPLSPPALPEGDEAAVAAAALLPAGASNTDGEDVNGRVRDIIACLYDDSLSEDAALEQLTSLAASLPLAHLQAKQQASVAGTSTSTGCSPLPAGRAGGSKVDASTDALSHRGPRYMADAATETPADMPASYVGTGLHTPAEGGAGSPRLRLGGVVPPLDLAALVAQAMEAAPASHRSTTSTAAGAGAPGPSFNAFSQFVLAQPEKLQRLIMRHAAATSARPSMPAGGGLLAGGQSSTSGASTSGMPAFPGAAGPTTGLEGAVPSNGSFTSRPSLTSRLLGLGGAGSSSSNNSNINRPPVAPPPPQPSSASASSPARGNTAGVLLPSASINSSAPMASPAKAIKRSGSAGLPKFASALDAAPMGAGAPRAAPAAPGLNLGLLAPKSSGAALGEIKPLRADVGGGLGGLGSTDLDAEFGGFFPSGSSGVLAVRR